MVDEKEENNNKLDEEKQKELREVAYSLCPYEHPKDNPCYLCKKIFEALEKAYIDGCEACF